MKEMNEASSKSASQSRLIVRNAETKDLKAIRDLSARAYPGMEPYSIDMIRGHLNHWPEGQFVADFDGQVVGYCATFRVAGEQCLRQHTWKEITGNGFAARHNSNGDYLYGMEVCVDPAFRNQRIGQRLYAARKKLCQYYRLKGIVAGGRIPRLARNIKRFQTPEAYVEAVDQKQFRDPTLTFQLRNGFEVLGVLRDYLPADKESLGHAVHLLWRNTEAIDMPEAHVSGKPLAHSTSSAPRMVDLVRVACVQYQQRKVNSFEEFSHNVEYFVDVVADYRCDFVCFPEYFTMQLLSIANQKQQPRKAIQSLADYTDRFIEFMTDLAIRYNIHIIGGTHPIPTADGEGVENVAFVFLRDGSVHTQSKIHATPDEAYWWNVRGGNRLEAIDTDCGPIGVLVCYDSEFPELSRHLVNQGAQIIFVPFCTAERQGYLRVRYCAHARAVENQIYVALAGNVGNLPGVENMDIQYAQSCILTPCDFMFSRDGIAADTTPNVEMIAIADLRPENLIRARSSGAVRNLKDRRYDLYSVHWHGKE